MVIASIDTSELEYLKSCRDKLRDIVEILSQDEKSDEEKLEKIKKMIGGGIALHKSKKKQEDNIYL